MSKADHVRSKIKLVCGSRKKGYPGWPHVDFDHEGLMENYLHRLQTALPNCDFTVVFYNNAFEAREGFQDNDQYDGVVIFNATHGNGVATEFLNLKTPGVIVDELHAGSGDLVRLNTRINKEHLPVVVVASSDFNDTVNAVRLLHIRKQLKNSKVVLYKNFNPISKENEAFLKEALGTGSTWKRYLAGPAGLKEKLECLKHNFGVEVVIKTKEDLANRIETVLHPIKYAVIVHDQETDKEGNRKEADMHAMLCFKNARFLSAVAKKLGDKEQFIEKWDGDVNNGFSYLLHRTKDAKTKGKHQYDPSEVIANFDFSGLINQIENKVTLKQYQAQAGVKFSVDELLNALYSGIMTKEEVEKHMTGAQYGRYRRQVEDVWRKRLQLLADEWRQEMAAQGRQVKVIWIYGASGVGKTRLARAYAEKLGQSYYMTGSSRDLFQNYKGEHTLIIDELRPNVIPYQDLLRILDP